MKIYFLDSQRIFSHEKEISPYDTLPSSAMVTLTAPPTVTGTEVAQWNGTAWLVLASRPPVPEPQPQPEPEPIRILTKLQFRNRFSHAEKLAIYGAAQVSLDIQIFLDDINAAENINLDDPATVGGVQSLEAGGLIAAGRAVEILL